MSLENHLVVHLQQMYVNERDYQIYLCDWSGKARDQQLKLAISAQVHDIDDEMKNLQQCLTLLNAPLDDSIVSPLVLAFRREDELTMQGMPNAGPMDMDVHLAMTDVTFSNAEIGTYQGLLTMARVLNRADVAALLEDTLQHEEDDLQEMQTILTDLIDISKKQ